MQEIAQAAGQRLNGFYSFRVQQTVAKFQRLWGNDKQLCVHLFELQQVQIAQGMNYRVRSPDLWENEVAPISVIGTAGEGVDELEVGPGVRQLGGVELG